MLLDGITSDARTFPTLLKACAALGILSHALSLHQQVLVHGHASDVYIASSLIHMYSKCGASGRACQVFDEMPEKNVVPWTAIVSCYSENRDTDYAFYMYNRMRHDGVQPNSVTILSLLAGVVELRHLQCVHACVVRCGFHSDLKVANCLLNVYGRCGQEELAQKFFDTMSERDIVSWNSLVSGNAQNGCLGECVALFIRMKLEEEIKPDHQTFASLVSAVADESDAELGKCIHAHIISSGHESDAHIQTAIVGMYLKCRGLKEAFDIFGRSKHKDVISWTATISGLVQNQNADHAVVVFRQMLSSSVAPSSATIASALAACAQLASFNLGASVHGYVIRRRMEFDVTAHNSLITMYSKCGRLKQCVLLFNAMKCRDLVSWNSIIAGYAQNGHVNEAFLLLNNMRISGQRPDSITMVPLLQACASLGLLQQGKWVHNFILRNGLRSSVLIDTALIDMYSKCGEMESAERCFNRLSCPDLVSWSALIAAYGNHGKGEIALKLYNNFLQTGSKPNHIIFLSVLSACSHSGLVSQGLSTYQSMTAEFGINPNLEHHACVVDLLCRAGRLLEAHRVAGMVLPRPNVDILGIVLNACRTHKNAELGDIIAEEILALKPESAGNYVQLAHCYASVNKWDAVSDTLLQMRSLKLRKTPGWSFIDLKGHVTMFFVDQSSHPQYNDIISTLKILQIEMSEINRASNLSNA